MNINMGWQWQRKPEVLAKRPNAQDGQVGFVTEWEKKNGGADQESGSAKKYLHSIGKTDS